MKSINRMFPQWLILLIDVNLSLWNPEEQDLPMFNDTTNSVAGYYYELDLKEMFGR